MVVITTADGITLKDLDRFVEPVEIYDETGRFIGLFVPANMERGKKLYAELRAQTDWAEIESRHKPGERNLTTAEVLEHLRSLGDSSSLPAQITPVEENPGCALP